MSQSLAGYDNCRRQNGGREFFGWRKNGVRVNKMLGRARVLEVLRWMQGVGG